MDTNGFYIIKDEFFSDFDDPYLRGNKKENRPHYYAFHDDATDLYWMIPLSSKIGKYQAIINDRIANHKPCDTLFVCKTNGDKESVFLIQDMFPITDEYISRPYTIDGNPYKLFRDSDIKEIQKKARRTLALIKRGVKFSNTSPDVLSIEKQLLESEAS